MSETSRKYQWYLLYGPSGSGKGTQTKLLKNYLESQGHTVLKFSTGDAVRALVQGERYTEKLIKECLDNGGLLPTNIPVMIWSQFLLENFTGSETIIFDGIARRESESFSLGEALRFYGCRCCVINLVLSDEDAQKRMEQRGRSDDTKENIIERLSWYHEEVALAIERCRNTDVFDVFDIDGAPSVDEVAQSIRAVVN